MAKSNEPKTSGFLAGLTVGATGMMLLDAFLYFVVFA